MTRHRKIKEREFMLKLPIMEKQWGKFMLYRQSIINDVIKINYLSEFYL